MIKDILIAFLTNLAIAVAIMLTIIIVAIIAAIPTWLMYWHNGFSPLSFMQISIGAPLTVIVMGAMAMTIIDFILENF